MVFGRNNLIDYEAELSDSKGRKISEFIIHPDWASKSNLWTGDVAIGVFKRIEKFAEFYKPICLNDKSIDLFYNQQGTVTGWGSTNVNGSEHSLTAMKFSLTIVSNAECERETPGLTKFAPLTSFCAGNISRSAACNG